MPSATPPSRTPSPVPHYDSDRLHHTHSTLGYRAGISQSKPAHIQRGFDESYPLGARLGLRVGWLLGVLSSLPQTPAVLKTRQEAELALSEEKVFGKEWWETEGVWKWEVVGEEITLEDVVEQWPVWVEWKKRVREVAEGCGVVVRFTETESLELHAGRDLSVCRLEARAGDAVHDS